jgi:acyl carrier protein
MSGSQLTPERLHKRLGRIFSKTFPNLDPHSVQTATMERVPAWDSIATLTLFMQCEEDFGIKIGYDRIAETKSYQDLFRLVESAAG